MTAPVFPHTAWRLVAAGLLAAFLACSAPAAAAATLAPAAGRFLVASAAMSDPRFRHSVILLVRYGPDGAIGLAVNRPSRLTLDEAFPRLDEMRGVRRRLWLGGPVEPGRPALLVMSAQPVVDALAVTDTVHYSRSEPLLRSLAQSPQRRYRVYAGYAGWSPGQLDAELVQRAWKVVPASPSQIFDDDPEALWRTLDAGDGGTWVDRGATPGPVTAGSLALAHDVQRLQIAVATDAHRQQHRAAAYGAVLDQLAVAGRAVHQHRVGLPAPGAGHIRLMEHRR